MYNQVSLEDLIERCRQRADMLQTQFVTDEEITSYLNESLGELYDLIVQNAGIAFDFIKSQGASGDRIVN